MQCSSTSLQTPRASSAVINTDSLFHASMPTHRTSNVAIPAATRRRSGRATPSSRSPSVAEILRLDPDDLAVALDDDGEAVFLVAQHGATDALFQRAIDRASVVNEDAVHVFPQTV